ncbi:MAG TPA: acireductone synthase [Terracidiphilus sp.]|jgi:enolase-phosphatase E1|nr:acireductone synthase [Terracidiphilus sp.]
MTESSLVYLLDVEGTVAHISLVSEHLFPYARIRFPDFLRKHSGDEAVRADLALLSEENRAEKSPGTPRLPLVTDAAQVETPRFRLDAMVYLTWLMDRDRKSTALKSLQGKIWKAGFESGQLKGTLFEDVPEAFARWSRSGRVAIYSSGSVEAQQLLFRYSTFGDLTPLIAGYFDTRIGAKSESASYSAIAKILGIDSNALFFFSDVVRELDAARVAGCQTRLVLRPGNVPVEDPHGHTAVESFVLI